MRFQMTQWRRVPAADELAEIVMLVSTSWEVPLPGVRDQNEAALVQLLELAAQRRLDGQLAEDDALRRLADVDALWRDLLEGVSWRVKNKYLVLRVLAPRVGRPALLAALRGPQGPASALVHGLLLGTADPHLASAATAVYTAVLARLDLDEWTTLCLPAVAAALDGRSRYCHCALGALHPRLEILVVMADVGAEQMFTRCRCAGGRS